MFLFSTLANKLGLHCKASHLSGWPTQFRHFHELNSLSPSPGYMEKSHFIECTAVRV